MFDWIEASWKDIKGNVKWDFIKYVFGGGVIATGYALFRATTSQWRIQILLFVLSVIGFAAISLYQKGRRVRLGKADSQLKERFDLAIKTSDSTQQENRRLRDQLGQTEEKVEQILSVLKQAKLECDEIYADVILGWLRDHLHSTGYFSTVTLTQSLELSEDAVRRGLGLLKSKYRLVSQGLPDVDMWTFVAASSPLIPKYKIVIAAPEQMSRKPLEDSKALATLPVYHHHFTVELLEVCQGFSMQWQSWHLFLRVRMICKETVGVREIKAAVYIDGQRHEGTLLCDIDKWFLRRKTELAEWPYKQVKEEDLESLWKKVEGQPMKSGEPILGWLGFLISEHDIEGRSLKRVSKLWMTIDDGLNRKQIYIFRPPWPVNNGEVLGAQWRQSA